MTQQINTQSDLIDVLNKQNHPWGKDEYGFWVEFKVLGTSFKLRWIWPGEYVRNTETNGKKTKIDEGLWVAETPVTQAVYEAVVGNNPSKFNDNPQNPVETVSWNDAKAFIAKLNGAQSLIDFDLPTEEEWEYFARAGQTTRYYTGDTVTKEQANFDNNCTTPVGSYPPNQWGLRDVLGNVWEWCLNEY